MRLIFCRFYSRLERFTSSLKSVPKNSLSKKIYQKKAARAGRAAFLCLSHFYS